MRNVLKKRKFRGYPINIPFTDVKMVLEKVGCHELYICILITSYFDFIQVKSMCVHETKHPNIQFVLAVKAFPLVNNIVSLWIFLGTLEENAV